MTTTDLKRYIVCSHVLSSLAWFLCFRKIPIICICLNIWAQATGAHKRKIMPMQKLCIIAEFDQKAKLKTFCTTNRSSYVSMLKNSAQVLFLHYFLLSCMCYCKSYINLIFGERSDPQRIFESQTSKIPVPDLTLADCASTLKIQNGRHKRSSFIFM